MADFSAQLFEFDPAMLGSIDFSKFFDTLRRGGDPLVLDPKVDPVDVLFENLPRPEDYDFKAPCLAKFEKACRLFLTQSQVRNR